MTKATKARVLSLEADLNSIVEGTFDFAGNESELDAVVAIAEELLQILKGDK
jgi:hypothetical protein